LRPVGVELRHGAQHLVEIGVVGSAADAEQVAAKIVEDELILQRWVASVANHKAAGNGG
jgi:hypothetical protein